MKKLKISLVKGGIFSIPCSTVFIKHIEGLMCRTEMHLNAQVDGKLETFYQENEKKADTRLSTKGKYPFEFLHILNFHRADLPFTYLSVDQYARRFLKLAICDPHASKIATTIHGPGSGLDASEALEVMLYALAEELSFTKSLGSLQEVLFIERDPEIFEKLETRLKYLEVSKGLVETEGDDVFLVPSEKGTTRNLKNRTEQLSKSVFIAMPFSEDFDDIYLYGIKKPVDEMQYTPECLKHEKYMGDIVDRIKIRIKESKLVIADISGNNPNVFYEVGFAQALGKPVILISQEQEAPFDLCTQQRIFYSSRKIGSLEKEVSAQLKQFLLNGK